MTEVIIVVRLRSAKIRHNFAGDVSFGAILQSMEPSGMLGPGPSANNKPSFFTKGRLASDAMAEAWDLALEFKCCRTGEIADASASRTQCVTRGPRCGLRSAPSRTRSSLHKIRFSFCTHRFHDTLIGVRHSSEPIKSIESPFTCLLRRTTRPLQPPAQQCAFQGPEIQKCATSILRKDRPSHACTEAAAHRLQFLLRNCKPCL